MNVDHFNIFLSNNISDIMKFDVVMLKPFMMRWILLKMNNILAITTNDRDKLL